MSDLRNFSRFCRKIVCVGRNYIEHAAELNNPLPKTPLLFLKPPTSMITRGDLIERPATCKILHHEVELGVVIETGGKNIEKESALDHVGGYVLALDMTARDLQDDIKAKSHPWLLAKCWDTFCPVSDFVPKDNISDVNNLDLWCKVNGELKQSGNTKDMIFDIPHIISYVSGITTLERGDLILTGTPKGVGPLNPGDTITCGLKDIVVMEYKVKS